MRLFRSQDPILCSLFLMSSLLSSLSALSTPVVVKSIALVTGATDGIGLTTAKNLAEKGYRVIVHGRDPERIKKACQIIGDAGNPSNPPIPIMADLSTISGCLDLVTLTKKSCLSSNSRLNLLINNAGVYSDKKKIVGETDLEETFAVNVLAPFIITSLLMPLLTTKSTSSRIIFVSSISQCPGINDWENVSRWDKRRYSAHSAYSESKLMDAMLCMEFAKRLSEKCGTERVTVNTLDPGTVNTKMLLAGWGPIGVDVGNALDQTWLATSEEVEGVTGEYFVRQGSTKAGRAAYDEKERRKLWDILVQLSPKEVSDEWDNFSAMGEE